MDNIVYPKMRRKIEDIIGGDLVEMPSKAQVQVLYLSKDYEQESQELSVMSKSVPR